MQPLLSYTVPTDIEALPDHVDRLVVELQSHGLVSGDEGESLKLLLYELMVNALEHGNLEIPGSEKSRLMDDGIYYQTIQRMCKEPPWSERKIFVEAVSCGPKVRISIRDEGLGFDGNHYLSTMERPSQECNSGRGLFIVRSLAPSVRYNDRGNKVTIEFDSY